MNKRADVLNKALKRLEKATQTIVTDQQYTNMVYMLADKMAQNGLTFFLLPDEKLIAFATIRHIIEQH